MSVWTFVEGTIRVRKDAHMGIKELILENFASCDCRNPDVKEVEFREKDDSRFFSFSFSFCDDGISAAETVDDFRIQAKKISTYVDMYATIRFLG